ncbi:PD-(D/E)XK nuclease family transposase [Pedobacter sp. JY14-1]|uniref:PD-(D/E)XK nuclease family transposase n=1 Tax=Pedobacter sp. JY14-1 TaxID=3034151 RepID=UPI0023E103BC|nr:PD-(D/E)XK nuclease family transposase [Pedobacter sp. JY14-1]
MQHSKYINPLLDLSFKKLFGTDLNKDLLLNLLNAVFNGRKELIDLQYNKISVTSILI